MYFIISAAWITVTIISWLQDNRKLPIAIGVLGLLTQVGIWVGGVGYWGITVLAVLTVVGMFSAPDVFFRR
jgi:hypothetical protein